MLGTYPDRVKEFVVYTGLRAVLFAATLAIVIGIWAGVHHGDVDWLLSLVIAFLLSGIASWILLDGQRMRFAARVEQRAHAAAARFEEMRGSEDDD
jgi:hypothetical protein